MYGVIVRIRKQEKIQHKLFYSFVESFQMKGANINDAEQGMCLSILQIVECIMISKIHAVSGINEILRELLAKSLYGTVPV